ncbi:MAG: protein kinase [Sandaracinaceae bacterium]|nr:protein kinase [Sandaracinaceae bacterium]
MTSAATNEEGARAFLDVLGRTLPLASVGSTVGATIRQGVLSSAPHELPATRGAMPTIDPDVTLPRLEVRSPEGDNVADLELVRTLGEGGMGVVWLARQRTLAREVAVKRLKQDGSSAAATAAMVAEARATGAIEHPSVVPVHALGADEHGAPLLVMKRIEGDSLQALVRDPGHAAWPALERRHGDRVGAIVEILARVADALHFAHSRGIVHRDVKPENVMVGRFGEVYLVDWGVALRLSERSASDELCIVGTPSFMAPEMVTGRASDVEPRTDVYLLGATLHAAITGTPRHEGYTVTEVLIGAMLSRPKRYPAELAELGALANRATSADKDARPASALAFREALSDFTRHRGSQRLVREAEARLATLAELPADRLAEATSMQALTESRFALTQALREWSDNPDARAALDRALRLMIEAQLQHRSPDVAAALLVELSSQEPALEARIEALRGELAETRRLEALARREEQERDPLRTARQRAWIAVGFMVLTVILVTLGWRSEVANDGSRGMTEVMKYDGVLLGAALVFIATMRRRLFANRLGRQTAMVLASSLVAATVSDAIFWARDADPRAAGPSSLLAMGGVLAGAGIGIDVRFFVSSAFFVIGAIACGLVPSLTIPAVGAAALASMTLVLLDALAQLRGARGRT